MEIADLRSRETRDKLKDEGLHKVFIISIALKGAVAFFESLLGAALIFSGNTILFVLTLAQNYLIDDPNDFFATHFRALLHPSHELQVFGGLYLLSHGVVKLFLVIGLLRNKIWAYPASLAVFTLFILYQTTRWLSTHSVWLLVLTVADAVIMWLIWREYRHKVGAIVS